MAAASTGPRVEALGNITGQYNAIRRRWRVIAITVLVALVGSTAVMMLMKPRYTATAQVLLDPRKQNVMQSQSVLQGITLDASAVESEVSLVKSFSVVRRVVEKLALDQDTEFVGAGPSWLGRLSSFVMSPLRSAEIEFAIPAGQVSPEVAKAVVELLGRMGVRRIGITLVIEVSVTSVDARKAAKIANAVTDAYLVDQLEARYEAARRASGWLSERLSGLRDQVQIGERRVADYRAKFGIVDTLGGGVDKQQVSEISGQIALARASVAEKEAKFQQAQRLVRSGGNVAAVADVLQSPVVGNLRTQEAEVARKEADLAARYGNRHPLVVNVRAELNDVRRAIAREVGRIVSNLKNEYDVTRKREQSLQESLDRLTGVATQGDEARIKLRELEREAEASRNLYQSFLSRFKETREQSTLDTADSRVITPAAVPTKASFPRYSVVLGAAAFIGLAFGIGAALLLEYVENGFLTVEQAELALGIPVLSILPALEREEYDPEGKGEIIPGYVVKKPLSRFSEAIRTARVGVALSNVDHPPKLVLVTSSVPGEGKSTFASSFAASAAASGLQTLLIDGDLRHPTTSKLFGLISSPGLVDVLGGAMDPGEAMFRSPHHPTLSVLPAGSATKNSPDLLGSQKMAQLLMVFREAFDLVVVDTPPVTAVVDSLVVANKADKVVFVIEWQNTPREVVQRAMSVLGDNRHRIAGCILNKANVRQMRYHQTYYGYYSSQYNKRYDKYYQE